MPEYKDVEDVEVVEQTAAQKEKMKKISSEYINLLREFTRILNERGISGSVLEFSVYEKQIDDVLTEFRPPSTKSTTTRARAGLGIWGCRPDCVCGGLVIRF